jgi:hypothetical protein
MIECDEEKWVEFFWMNKFTLFQIVEKVWPLIIKQNTKYCKFVPMEIRVTCFIHKLIQSANLFNSNELFTIA